MLSRQYIETLAREAGFDLCGVARVRSLDEQKERFARWLGSGYDSRLEYMSRNFDKRFDPSRLVEGARTVIVCAVSYKSDASMREFAPDEPLIASYALARDYHPTIKAMLGGMLEKLAEAEPGIKGRAFCDTAPLLEKAWAIEAGIGWPGKNALIISPELGSFILLGELVIDREADSYSEPFSGDKCGACRRCMEGCPNGAIVEAHVVDTNRCISRLSVEKMDGQPSEYGLHGWIFGCDVCQRVCPWNLKSPPGSNQAFAPVVDPSMLTREFWQNVSEEEFDELFSRTPLQRRGYDQIKERIK